MDPWRLEHSPYTPEGEIEGAGRFAAGLGRRRARRPRRGRRNLVAALVVAAMVAPALVQLIQVVR